MRKKALTQKQRLLSAGLYIVIICILYGCLNGSVYDLLNQSEPTTLWFFSGILLVILGMYVTEPYFTSPTDTLSNSLSLILVLTAVTSPEKLHGYWFLLIGAVVLFLLSLVNMLFKDCDEKFCKISYKILKTIGSSRTMFSLVYLFSAFSYFTENIPMLIAAVTLWILMVPIDVLSCVINLICEIVHVKKDVSSYIGVVVRNSEDSYYTISVNKTKANENILINEKNMLFITKKSSCSYVIALEVNRINCRLFGYEMG